MSPLPRSSALLRALAILCVLTGLSVGPCVAQRTVPIADTAQSMPAPDYEDWKRIATQTDAIIADPNLANDVLDNRRAQIVDWREKFLAGQNANAGRIATLNDQIAALGPAPAEGATEADDVAARRKDLNDQLAVLKAPAQTAVDAYARADGLIREIDSALRARKAAQFLRRWPTPLNPANWLGAWQMMKSAGERFAVEMSTSRDNPAKQAEFRQRLPIIVALIVVAIVLIFGGRRLTERYALRLATRASNRAQAVWSFFASLGQIAVPMLGIVGLSTALSLTGLSGDAGDVLPVRIVYAGFVLFFFRWLGEQGFPKIAPAGSPVRIGAERRKEGRFLTRMIGILIGIAILRDAILPISAMREASAAVILYPTVVLAAILAYRLGHILTRNLFDAASGDDGPTYRNQVIGLIGRGAMIVSLIAPVIGAAGYVSAARGIMFPTIASMALFAFIFTLQRFVGDLYALLTKSDDTDAQNALAPVLIGFILTLLALPILALIWGARTSDLSELFTRFREGFQIGETRISPSDFVFLVVVFAIGMLVTRLFQGALRSSILPKTKLDTGGKNAILAGISYLGIFLSALIAINAAGLNLSGLAIVAGALSVGIGFGLQNIVSNFVSGIILLIERPVSEGDWIEVGGVMGTVKSISVRSTRILTFDRSDVIVPNSDLISGMVTNWTRFSLAGRLIVKVGVSYGSDTRKVERILREIAEAQPLAVLNPPPQVLMMEFGEDRLQFEMRLILRDVNFSLSVRSDINHEISRRFAEEGIDMPIGHRDIWLRNPETLQQMWPHDGRGSASGRGTTGALQYRPDGPDDPHPEGPTNADADTKGTPR